MEENRRLAAIMFTDIVGYTSLMGSDEDRAFQLLRKNRNIQRPLIRKYRGEWLKEMGDGVLASFYTASDAVRCAGEIQRASKEEGINLRIGIHEGEVVFAGGDVLGDGVNIASRLEEMAAPGCIYISGAVYRDIKNKTGIDAVFVGEESFKNVDEPIRVYKSSCRETGTLLPEDKRLTLGRWPWRFGAVGMVILFAGIFIWRMWMPANHGITAKRAINSVTDNSIAVLPLLYLSEDPDKKYLAEGVADAITSHLARIGELRVTARTSVERYRDHSMDVRDIGKELSVGYLLEGSFQMHGNEVRLIVQLINTGDGSHVWSNEYDREWSDIFKVQSEVAQAIAGAIRVAVSPLERTVIEEAPTRDLTAYEFYLRGKEYRRLGFGESDFRYAFEMYERSIEIDSGFVLPWVGLASICRELYWFYHDRSEESLTLARSYLDRAKALAPALKEVRLEEARYLYHCRLDHQRSLAILESLNADYPRDDQIILWMAYVYRRMGDFSKSLDYNNRAIDLNPTEWEMWSNAAFTYIALREYGDAERYLRRSMDLNPSYSDIYKLMGHFYIRTGHLEKAKKFIADHEIDLPAHEVKFFRSWMELLSRNYDAALGIAMSMSEDEIQDQDRLFTKQTLLGFIFRAVGEEERAARHFEIERDLMLGKIGISQYDHRLYRTLGIAYAGLGAKEKAQEAIAKAIKLLNLSLDPFGGYEPEIDRAIILVMIGKYDEALVRLSDILSRHGRLTSDFLEVDPVWDPVRNRADFKALVSNPAYRVSKSLECIHGSPR